MVKGYKDIIHEFFQLNLNKDGKMDDLNIE